jgi:hypothetical protein
MLLFPHLHGDTEEMYKVAKMQVSETRFDSVTSQI